MKLSSATVNLINTLVERYEEQRHQFEKIARDLAGHLTDSQKLRPFVHSIRYRAKDGSHLKDKLFRWAFKNKGVINLTPGTLFTKVNDLAGVRVLHLHTQQMADLKNLIDDVLREQMYEIIEGPIANTWDDEYKAFFEQIGIKTQPRETLYTSVHYIIKNNSRTKFTCELQVRTLLEEVWGEVSHKINYPKETNSIACKEQIKVLARVTSAGTRLVDSLFASHKEFSSLSPKSERPAAQLFGKGKK